MIFNKISNNFVFKTLKHIKHGHLKLTNFNNDVFYFGDEKENLKAEIKINKPVSYTHLTLPTKRIV